MIRFRNGTVWTSQKVLFQLFFIMQLGFCAIFTRVSDHARSPSLHLGMDIHSKVPASVFMNMEPSLSLPLIEQNVNPRVWADGKSVGRAPNAIPVVAKLKDPHLFPHKKCLH